MANIISIIIGGAIGSLSRFFLTGFVHRFFHRDFAYGTIVVNMIGCFLIGLIAGLADKFNIPRSVEVLLVIGFCGAFTTFSTFMLETSEMMRNGQNLYAFLNIAISIILGFALLRLGVWIGEVV